MDSQLLTMLRKAAAKQGGAGFALRFTGLSILCAVLFGILLTPLAKKRTRDTAEQEASQNSPSVSLINTGRTWDLAIVGDGYFQVNFGSQNMYTRAGNFAVNSNGGVVLASADGDVRLDPEVMVPRDTETVSISSNGVITVKQIGRDELTTIGLLQLVRFRNPKALIPHNNIFEATDAAGQPMVNDPGQDGMGTICQGHLEEGSSVTAQKVAELYNERQKL